MVGSSGWVYQAQGHACAFVGIGAIVWNSVLLPMGRGSAAHSLPLRAQVPGTVSSSLAEERNQNNGSGRPGKALWKIRTSRLADADTRPVVSADHGSCRPLVARRLPQAPTQGGAVATLTPDGSCLRPHCPTAPFVRFPDPMIIDSIRYPITMCIRPFPEQHVGVGSSRFVHPAQRSAACDPTRVYLTLQHPSSWPRCAHPEFSGHFFCYRPPRWKHNPSSSMRTISTHR